jgi:hypothetical protein
MNASVPLAKYRSKKSSFTYNLHGFSPEMLTVCVAEGYVSSAHTKTNRKVFAPIFFCQNISVIE